MKTSAKIVSGLVMTLVSGAAMAGIANTKHNMGSGSGGNEFFGTSEICVFCHTPHGSNVDAIGAPLWNRELTATSSYTQYSSLGTATLDGNEEDIGSVSIACLSCHDGTQAINSVINSPGSGMRLGEAITTSGGVQASGVMTVTGGFANTGWSEFDKFSSGATVEPDKFFFLGTDLTNDHPIGIAYAGGGDATDQTLHVDDSFFAADVITDGNGVTRYYVDTDSVAGRSKVDLPLYNRGAGSAGDPTQQYVECASCHDPHTETDLFLRIGNEASITCLTCHNK